MTKTQAVPEQPRAEAPDRAERKTQRSYVIRCDGHPYYRVFKDKAEADAYARDLTTVYKRRFYVIND